MAKLAPLPNRPSPSEAFADRNDPQKEKGMILSAAGNPNNMRNLNPGETLAVAGQGNELFGQDQLMYFDYNLHSLKKGMSSALLDVALLMANVSQLKSIYLAGHHHPFYTVMMTLLILSIILQVLSAFIVVLMSRININVPDNAKHRQAVILANLFLVSVFLLTIINIFISAIGVSDQETPRSQATVICNQIFMRDLNATILDNATTRL